MFELKPFVHNIQNGTALNEWRVLSVGSRGVQGYLDPPFRVEPNPLGVPPPPQVSRAEEDRPEAAGSEAHFRGAGPQPREEGQRDATQEGEPPPRRLRPRARFPHPDTRNPTHATQTRNTNP